MKLVETHDIGDGWDEYSGKGSLSVSLRKDDGEFVKGVTIYAGEPEDNTFYRDLDGAFSIADLVKAAYEAGKSGEPLTYEFIDENAKEAV